MLDKEREPGTNSLIMISIQQVSKIYGAKGKGVTALDNVSLEINDGELVSLIGSSGSGKSTLLNVIGGIDAPTSGTIIIDGHDVTKAGDREMTLLRRDTIGIIFQFFNLMPTLTVLENVMLPAELAGRNGTDARNRAMELLEGVGMAHRAAHRPDELSGGEMQRTAIARALMNRPHILLADEPTGNLDSRNGQNVLELLQRIVREQGLTLVMATHDPVVAHAADRVIEMRDVKMVGQKIED
jgi:putative ABC transport system ATP-binding protein